MEFRFNAKGTGISKDKEIPKQLKNGDNVALNVKVETTAESETKQAIKISAQYGMTEYAEVTTIVIDGTKLYVNVGALTDFIKSVDETIGKQVETHSLAFVTCYIQFCYDIHFCIFQCTNNTIFILFYFFNSLMVDETIGKQVETVFGQLGAGRYISLS